MSLLACGGQVTLRRWKGGKDTLAVCLGQVLYLAWTASLGGQVSFLTCGGQVTLRKWKGGKDTPLVWGARDTFFRCLGLEPGEEGGSLSSWGLFLIRMFLASGEKPWGCTSFTPVRPVEISRNRMAVDRKGMRRGAFVDVSLPFIVKYLPVFLPLFSLGGICMVL